MAFCHCRIEYSEQKWHAVDQKIYQLRCASDVRLASKEAGVCGTQSLRFLEFDNLKIQGA